MELVLGSFASGKTATLVQRWLAAAREHGPSRVLFVVARPGAVGDVRRRMIAAARGEQGLASGPLVVATWTTVALDLVRRSAPELAEARFVAGAARSADAAAASNRAPWRASAAVAQNPAFVHAAQRGLSALARAQHSVDDVLARAEECGVRDRWEELVALNATLAADARAAGTIDFGDLFERAAAAVMQGALSDRFDHVLVDDADSMTHAQRSLLDAFDVPVTLSARAGDASHIERLPDPPEPTKRLVWCRHPSIEADAIVGELEAAHDDGRAWHELAVIVPRRALPIARAVVRAMQRQEIPVHVALADGDAEPVVRQLCAALAQHDPAADAITTVEVLVADALRALAASADIVAPEPSVHRALDALVAFQRGATRWAAGAAPATVSALLAALDDDEVATSNTPDHDGNGVAVLTPEDAAGRHWRCVVVAGCVEGEYPRSESGGAWFDPAICDAVRLEAGPRRAAQMVEQRRRFDLVASRAPEVVFVTAPQPGVLVSRYVEDLAAADARPAWPEPKAYEPRPATIATTPIHPSGSLRLSASQLSTYEDCPRRWFYDNVLRLHDSTSVWADFGTLVHDVLEAFLSPRATVEYSLDALLDLADAKWTDDIAQFAPQREQARREVRDVLENWWAMEGEHLDRNQVIAVEHDFDVAVGPHSVRGRIDRVDWDADRGGLRVVDYKTGRKPPSDAEVANDIQLGVYYLAARRSEPLVEKGDPVRLELLYVRSKKFLEQAITDGHEARAEQRILDAAAEMVAEHIEPLPTAECDYCDYHRLCPLQRAGREVGVR